MLNVVEMEHALRANNSDPAPLVHGVEDLALARLEDCTREAVRQHPDLEINLQVLTGSTKQRLLEVSGSAHLLVLGSRGFGPVRSTLLGSVGTAVTRAAVCPTVVVRPPHATGPSNGIIVGADGAPESQPVLEFAFTQAALRGRPLTVVHCMGEVITAYAEVADYPTPAEMSIARTRLTEITNGLAEKHPDVELHQRVERGLIDQVVIREGPWDLVVVGRHRRYPWERLLVGSSTTAVLERAHSPVAVVPEAGPQHR